MINAITGILSNPTLASVAQNTKASISIETGLKAVGRPSFILADKDITPETKKYAATKEFLYQAICLGVYLALVMPVFKGGAFKLAKKTFYKNKPGFDKFKNASEYLDYHKFADMKQKPRVAMLSEAKNADKFKANGMRDALMNEAEPNKYPLIKGVIEAGSIIGSVLGLAVLAPQVSHHTIHPIMKALGFEKKPEKQTEETQQKVDVKA